MESSNANRDGDQREKLADGTENVPATLSKEDLLEAMKVMGTQVAAMAQLFTPLVNSWVGQTTPMVMTTPNANGSVVETVEVIEIDPPERTGKKVDYLSLLQHLSHLGTKHFPGSSSTRCPEDYKRDIAVHFLEGDAHNWWLVVDKRTNGSLQSFADFEDEFNRKYFPAEAWDRLEGRFLDLTQGRRAVREYEDEFNRLRQFVGRELEDETVQVRRFIRGLWPELRTHCSFRTLSTVGELVERVALLESNLAEERSQSVPTGKTNDRKRKWDQVDGGKASSG